jgi:hypothetical protein
LTIKVRESAAEGTRRSLELEKKLRSAEQQIRSESVSWQRQKNDLQRRFVEQVRVERGRANQTLGGAGNSSLDISVVGSTVSASDVAIDRFGLGLSPSSSSTFTPAPTGASGERGYNGSSSFGARSSSYSSSSSNHSSSNERPSASFANTSGNGVGTRSSHSRTDFSTGGVSNNSLEKIPFGLVGISDLEQKADALIEKFRK